MAEKHTSIAGRTAGRTGKAVDDSEGPVEAPPGSGGMEALAAAVAVAIDRRRRASRSMAPAFETAKAAGPDEWAMSGRLAQVDRFPSRDPWNR